jgi:hypothetical protein
MIITDKRNESCSFEELCYGDVFTFNGVYYMKVREEGDINAVGLVTGGLSYFEEGDVVTPVEVELVIH